MASNVVDDLPSLSHPAQLRVRISFIMVFGLIATGLLLGFLAKDLFALGLTLAVCGVCLTPMVGAFWWQSRWIDQRLRLLPGDHLAHWKFSDEEWRQVKLLDATWRSESAGVARNVTSIAGGMAGFITWLGWMSPRKELWSRATGAGAVVLGAGLGWLGGILIGMALYAWRELPDKPGEVLISRELIWFSGRLYQLRRHGFTPLAAHCYPGTPSYVEFVYEQIGSSGPETNHARVPVPKGAENSEELLRVLESFNP